MENLIGLGFAGCHMVIWSHQKDLSEMDVKLGDHPLLKDFGFLLARGAAFLSDELWSEGKINRLCIQYMPNI